MKIAAAICAMLFATAIRPGWLGLGFSYHVTDGRGWLLVERIAPGSPSEKAGIRAQDVIVAIDGHPLTFKSDVEVLDQFASMRSGTAVKFTLAQRGKSHEVSVVPAPMSETQYAQWLINYERARSKRSR